MHTPEPHRPAICRRRFGAASVTEVGFLPRKASSSNGGSSAMVDSSGGPAGRPGSNGSSSDGSSLLDGWVPHILRVNDTVSSCTEGGHPGVPAERVAAGEGGAHRQTPRSCGRHGEQLLPPSAAMRPE